MAAVADGVVVLFLDVIALAVVKYIQIHILHMWLQLQKCDKTFYANMLKLCNFVRVSIR